MKLDRKGRIVAAAAVVVVVVVAAAALAWSRRGWVSYPTAEVVNVRNVHDYKGKPLCQACHLERDARIKADPVVLCQRCHTFGHGNHPVRVAAKKAVSDLPLWAKDQVVCHTCHDPHDVRRRKGGLRLAFNELCDRCHPGH